MIDISRLREDAQGVLTLKVHELDPAQIAHVAAALLRILDDPSLITPEGWALVKKPELLGRGVPRR